MSEGGAQPKPMQSGPETGGGNKNIAILIGVLAVTGVLGYFIFKNKTDGLGGTVHIPRAMQITKKSLINWFLISILRY
jgi:LPXTG-motif cell wall-anchored protein